MAAGKLSTLAIALLLGIQLAVAPLVLAGAGATVKIGGNGSAHGAVKLVAEAYLKLHPGVTVTLVPNLGSSGGIAALTQGAIDLAISARPLRGEEQKAGLQTAEYARSPFLFAVHPGVPKNDVTIRELASLYRQDTVRWSDGSRVRLILRPEQDTSTTELQEISPELAQAVRQAHARPGMVVAVTDRESIDAIAKMPGALGAATLTEVVTGRRPIHELSFNGVAPTLKNLETGRYPLKRTYYLVTGPKSSPQALQFAQFLHSPQAREILRRAGNLTPADRKER